jgi:pimeloyl-ACP methyl ester carboxylesterase
MTSGDNRLESVRARLAGETIDIVTYRASRDGTRALLIMFAGRSRDAIGLVLKARRLAEHCNLTIIAPQMDRDRFPTWRYHRAGVAIRTVMQPRSHWLGPLVDDLVRWGHQWADLPSAPSILFGHSAGGQLLSRVAAYCPPKGVDRIVITNPSVYVAPSIDERAPHGFAALFEPAEASMRLRSYLSQPISVYLGCNDIGNKNLVGNPPALRQGKNRLERGRSIFRHAERLAKEQGWDFAWRLVEAPGVGHSSRGMLEAADAPVALGFEPTR